MRGPAWSPGAKTGATKRAAGEKVGGLTDSERKALKEEVARAKESWRVFRRDPVSFLTLHDSYSTRLYHHKRQPSFLQDAYRGGRGLVSGILRIGAGALRGIRPTALPRRESSNPYALVIGLGTAKYAFEEREIQEACKKSGIEPVTIRVQPAVHCETACGAVRLVDGLTSRDWIRVLYEWLREVYRDQRHGVARSAWERSLLWAGVPAIRGHSMCVAFAERLAEQYGTPRFVISLCPASAVSRAIVEWMRARHVVSGGIRTQATTAAVEHLAINVDVLFCKSALEKEAYAAVFGDSGPVLEDGCILSLPEQADLPPLELPEPYCLLLGTAPGTGRDSAATERYNDRLLAVAKSLGLGVVFKSHNLGVTGDEKWLRERQLGVSQMVYVTDIRRNRELIDRAAVVASTGSTLLYYAILQEKPIVLVEAGAAPDGQDEFRDAPVARIAWKQNGLDASWNGPRVYDSTAAVLAWFHGEYCHTRDAAAIVESLARRAMRAESRPVTTEAGGRDREN